MEIVRVGGVRWSWQHRRVESDSDDMKTVLLNRVRLPWEKMTDGFEVAVKNAVSVLPSSCATSVIYLAPRICCYDINVFIAVTSASNFDG